ncbi:cytoplasmic tRNA 2-thiolation protein 2 [Ditylenchus destructor]|nr:cytoplasmic tRNA 2-thiolation protein 2 [Ditylenchus destructor]
MDPNAKGAVIPNSTQNGISFAHKCVKCPSTGDYFGLDANKTRYCKPCFVKMVRHKFSYLLGKHRVFKEKEHLNALLVYTGDDASALLLALVREGLAEGTAKKLRLIPTILIFLDSLDKAECSTQMSRIESVISDYVPEWRRHYIHCGAALYQQLSFDQISNGYELPTGIEKCDSLLELLQSVKSKTVRNEIERLLKERLILRAASALGCDKILTAENSEVLANVSLNALCLGRGPAVSDLTGAVDQRFGTISLNEKPAPSVIRPLRDLCDREVETYLEIEAVTHLSMRKSNVHPETALPKISPEGVQGVTRKFLSNLQAAGYPATTTTILSVSSKVEPLIRDSAPEEKRESCQLCFCSNVPVKSAEAEFLEDVVSRYKLCRPCVELLTEVGEEVTRNICTLLSFE